MATTPASRFAAVIVGATLIAGCDAQSSNGNRSGSGQSEHVLGDVVLDIGATDSLPGHSLHQVSAARWLPDGRLIIANAGTAELRSFDGSGRMLYAVGRTGSGPGEFIALRSIWLVGDTIVAYDSQLQRLTHVAATDGAYLGTIALPRDERQIAGRFGDGSFLYTRGIRQRNIATGTSTVDTAVAERLVLPDTTHELTRFPTQTRFGAQLPTGQRIATALPLEPRGLYGAASDALYVGYGADSVLKRYTLDGAAAGGVAVPVGVTTLSPDMLTTWQNTVAEGMSAPREQSLPYLKSLPPPTVLPRFDDLIVDDLDRVWVRRFPVPGSTTAEWLVLSSAGAVQATVALDAKVAPLHIGAEHIVLLGAREDGAQRVTVHHLLLPGS